MGSPSLCALSQHWHLCPLEEVGVESLPTGQLFLGPVLGATSWRGQINAWDR